MEKIKAFFQNLNENRKYQVIFFVVSMCVVLGMYLIQRDAISENKALVINEDTNLVKYVEEVTITDETLVISGWCFYKNADSSDNKVKAFLKNLEDENDIIWLDVKRVVRNDVNKYFDCDVDYSQSGFEASAKIKDIDLSNNYEILLNLTYAKKNAERDDNRGTDSYSKVAKTVSTNTYLLEGGFATNKEEETLEIVKTASDTLNRVFNEGNLLLYRRDVDIYVYQYNGKIYWIAGESFLFEEDGTTAIQYHVDTTRPDKLPQNRVAKGLTTDNLGFYFEKEELAEDCSPYRVAECDIPSDYPVTCFWTGVYNDSSWKWKEEINLDLRQID